MLSNSRNLHALDQSKWDSKIISWGQWFIENWPGILLLSLLFTFLMLSSYILPLNALIPDRDFALQVWDLWLVNESITHGQSPYFTELQYYPVGAQLGRHVLSPGFFPVTFLVQIFSGWDILYPVYTYKIIILLSFALILCFSFLTLREIGLSFGASITPAVAYAFGNFYMHHVVRLHIIAGFFIPIAALFLIKLYKKPTLSNLLVCAILLSSGLYFTEFILFIYITLTILMGLMCLFSDQRKLLIDKFQLLGLKRLLAASFLFLLIASPFTYFWLTSDAEPPDPEEAYWYSSNLAAFFIPDQQSTPLYSTFFSFLSDKLSTGSGSSEVFVGFSLLLFWFISVVKIKQRLVQISILISVIFFVLSMGPVLKIFGLDTQLSLPYALLASTPPFNVGRTPVRFVVMGLFFWMIVAAFGLEWFYRFMQKYGQLVAWSAMLLIFFWTTAEVYSPTQRQQPYVIPASVDALVEGPVINLPLKYHNGWALFLQIFHKQPLATGYVSRNSIKHKAHFRTLRVLYEEQLQSGSCADFIDMGYRNVMLWPGVPDDVVLGLTQNPNCSLNVVDLRE